MNETRPAPSRLQRWIIGSVGALLAITVIIWASQQVIQLAIIVAVFVLGLSGVLFGAAWRQGVRWFFSRRALRFYGWLIAGIISVIVLFYAEENWRGKRAWAALQREVSARGESLDLSSLIPPPVADEENFALTPGLPRLLGYAESEPGETPARWGADAENHFFYYGKGRSGCPQPGNWAFQQPTDLAAWQKFFRRHPLTNSAPASNAVAAPVATSRTGYSQDLPGRLAFPVAPEPQTPAADVLLALSRYDSGFALLRTADQRSKLRYPLAYDEGWFAMDWPHVFPFWNFQAATRLLCLRATAELAEDQSQRAQQDTLLALRLGNSFGQMPYETLHRARADMLMASLQPVWEGLAHHRWNDQELAALQQHFEALDLLAEFRRASRGETLLMMNLADQLLAFVNGGHSRMAEKMRSAKGDAALPIWLFRLFYPTGWLYQDKVWIYRFYERHAHVAKPVEALKERISNAELLSATDPCLLIFIVPRLKELLGGGDDRALFLQTACNQAVAACALERYRLAQGQYPDSLDALLPHQLTQVPADPADPTGGKLRYRKEGNSGFVLYSIGLNGKDDQGTASAPIKDWQGVQDNFPDLDQGDWVWRQP